MDRKQSVIANVRYQSSKGNGAGKLKGILRYVQYRDDRDGHIPQDRGLERWSDHGLGDNFQTIAANCEAFKSPHVQAFTLVINPNPDLVELIPDDQREQFVRDLTENTIEHFFDARGLDTPEWAYALHRRETTEDGRDNPHTHVILPGTYDSWADGDRLPLYFNNRKNENHIEILHDVAQTEIAHLLDHYVGPDWEQRYDTLHPDSEVPELIQENELIELPPAPESEPDYISTHSSGEPVQSWVAVQGDLEPDVYHVGFLLRGEGEHTRNQVFVPVAEGLPEDEAEALAAYMKMVIADDPENGFNTAAEHASAYHHFDAEQRANMVRLMSDAPDFEDIQPNMTN